MTLTPMKQCSTPFAVGVISRRTLTPLGYLQPLAPPELALEGEAAARARRCYCGTIGAEFMHIPDAERRQWVAERMEADPPPVDSARVLDRLIRAGLFEQVLQSRYPGTKRFSLEGIVALIPVMDEVLDGAAALGAEQMVLGMSHRGRLNVMVHIVGKSAEDVFARFEDVDPRSFLGGGDVKYHLGATGNYRDGPRRDAWRFTWFRIPPTWRRWIPWRWDARAPSRRACAGGAPRCVLPLLLHGDAAFAGQGTAAETLNLANLDGYTVGGTVHVVVNNLIGFTANPQDTSSSRFAADVAKRLPIPIFHVNAEDPDAAVRAARWAVEYRYQFHSDVVVDLIGYRRHGHSEIDDPTTTQPVRYRRIAALPPVWESYARRHQTDAAPARGGNPRRV